MRPSQTFQKRQRELARQEKQRAKAQRKLQRKMEKQSATESPSEEAGGPSTETSSPPGPAL